MPLSPTHGPKSGLNTAYQLLVNLLYFIVPLAAVSETQEPHIVGKLLARNQPNV